MKQFVENLYTQMREQLLQIEDTEMQSGISLTNKLDVISENLKKLKAYVEEQNFTDPKDEIDFFKNDKPCFTSEYLYQLEIFTIDVSRPHTNIENLRAYYNQEIIFIKRFLERYKFLHAYYQFGMTELDHLLFIRRAESSGLHLPDKFDLDPMFSTAADYIFGKFMALDRLSEFLQNELRNLERSVKETFSDDYKVLIWTGESINLVELAYGIWLTGQINNGNASITEIINWLEVHFQIKIGKPHRRWQSIAVRKRVSFTKYIDELKVAMQKRLDEENGR